MLVSGRRSGLEPGSRLRFGTCTCNGDDCSRDAHSLTTDDIASDDDDLCATDSDRLVYDLLYTLDTGDYMIHDDTITNDEGQETPDRKGSSAAEGGASVVGGPEDAGWGVSVGGTPVSRASC